MCQIWEKKSTPGTDAHVLHSCKKLPCMGLKKFGKQKHHGMVERMWELAQRNMNSTITLPGKLTQVNISILILLPVPSL